MANRSYIDKSYSLVKGVTVIWGRFLLSGTTPVLQRWAPGTLGSTPSYGTAPTTGGGTTWPKRNAQGAEGIYSVARTGAGLWTVTFQDFYTRLLSLTGHCSLAGGTVKIVTIGENSTITALNTASNGGSVVGVSLLSSTATAADPDDGGYVNLRFEFQNSSAP
jgi:hypothetical protein